MGLKLAVSGAEGQAAHRAALRALDKHSELVALAKTGAFALKIQAAQSMDDLLHEYPSLVQRSYNKGGRYAVLDEPLASTA